MSDHLHVMSPTWMAGERCPQCGAERDYAIKRAEAASLDGLREALDGLLLEALDQLTGWTSNTSNHAVSAIALIEQARAALRDEGETGGRP